MAKPRKPSSDEKAPSVDVDRTSEDSFPASDPPSWAMGSAARAQHMNSDPDDALGHAASDHEGVQVAMLATDGFEQSELMGPKHALEAAGVRVDVISSRTGKIRSWLKGDWGKEIGVDVDLDHADPAEYDALVLPGGVMNPDTLRHNEQAVGFVKAFGKSHKPIAAICHGPWMLIEADLVRGRQVTSWPSLQTDIRNAGGKWVDKKVVEDDFLITSRMPDDVAEFSRTLLSALSRSTKRLTAHY